MRILLLSLFLAYAMPSFIGATPMSSTFEPAGLPQGLVVEILEAACLISAYFDDIGVEVLLGYYHDATLQISYQGRDAVNPIWGRYKVAMGGMITIVNVEDNL